jgi:hypothetical protein
VATLIHSGKQAASAPERRDSPNPRHMECAHMARDLALISQPEPLSEEALATLTAAGRTVTGFARQLGVGKRARAPAAPSSDRRPPATSPD